MSGTEWVAPGRGESLGALRAVFGTPSGELEDYFRKTSLLFTGGRFDEQDRLRYEEIERRAKERETL